MSRGKKKTIRCEVCGKKRKALVSQLVGGRGRFCGKRCQYDSWKIKAKEIRSCVACGKAFEVGGRGRPPKDVVRCSVKCKNSSRFRRTVKQIKELSERDAAYLAGIVDGEGSVMLFQRSKDSISSRVCVVNTNKDICYWILKKTGVGYVGARYDGDEKRKKVWTWLTGGHNASKVLVQINPYMIIKRKQANMAIDFQDRLMNPALKYDKEWQIKAKERMHNMNKKGPS